LCWVSYELREFINDVRRNDVREKVGGICSGASTVKWTQTMLRYTKTMFFFVKSLKVVAKCCLDWIYFHDDLYCCVKYSKVEYQVEIFITSLKAMAYKPMVERKFHDLKYFEVGSFSYSLSSFYTGGHHHQTL
jgi:hypothetical protein